MFRKGFTLIELLIVVAIIAILAAIAVPNFLEAQVRAKVSRVKSDLRTLATAIEAYTVDHNKQPLDYSVGRGDRAISNLPPGALQPSGIPHPGYGEGTGTFRGPGLSTPIAYISDCWLKDPFVSATESSLLVDYDQQVYTYNWFTPDGVLRGVNSPVATYQSNRYADHYGAWRIGSIGPDRNWYNAPGATSGVPRASIVYDPTNGTVSYGNIWRSQKEGEVKTRPPLDNSSN